MDENILETEKIWSEEFERYEVHPDDEIEKDLALVKIHQADGDIDVCTKGNFSAIVGFTKSRKSYFMAILISAFARGGVLYNKFMTEATGDRTAVLFDTEQGKFHLNQKLKAIKQMSKGFDNIRAYFLRRLDWNDRIGFIEEYLETYGDEVDLVVIDGIRDLLQDINDSTQANKVAQLLMRWTDDYNIHIICIIHQNKGDGYARGHIGTEIMAKAETVIKVDNEGRESRIGCDYSRDKPFDEFRIGIQDGIPYVTEDMVSHAEKKRAPEKY